MDEKQDQGAKPEAQGQSLKDQIISRIRAEGEMQGSGGQFRPTGPRPADGGGRDRAGRGGSLFGPGVRQMAAFARQLSTLVEVGIPLLRSLQILGERSATPRLRATARDLARRVEEGQTLSTAMSHHPAVFSSMFIGVVRAGEVGGILEMALKRLADVLERRAQVRQKVMASLTYPIITILVEIAVIFIILVYGLPRIVSAYPSTTDLPSMTQKLLATSAWLAAYWPAVLVVVALVVAAVWAVRQSASGRYAMQRAALSLPLVGGVIRKLNVERFARTLGGLTAAGIPLIDALTVTADSSDNEVVHRTLVRVRDTVEGGGKMETPLRSEPVFDPLVVDMVMVGDEAGALDTMLLKIADTYDSEVESSLQMLTSTVEPVLIVMLGLAVGFVAVAVFQPYVYMVRNPALMVE